MAVSGEAAFLSRTVWWSEQCFSAVLCFSRMLTGLRGSTNWDSFSCYPSTHCSVCTSEPQHELGQLFWQLSPAASERGIIITRGRAQHEDESPTNAVETRACLCMKLHASLCSNWRTSVTARVPVRKYAGSQELDPWILFLCQSVLHCCDHKSVDQSPLALQQGWDGFLSQWLTVIITEWKWGQVPSSVQKLRLHGS